VAGEAVVEHLVWLEFRKANDLGAVAERLDVSRARAVAAFATGSLRRLLAERNRLEMRIAVKARPEVVVAGASGFATGVGARRGRVLRAERSQRLEQDRQRQSGRQPERGPVIAPPSLQGVFLQRPAPRRPDS